MTTLHVGKAMTATGRGIVQGTKGMVSREVAASVKNVQQSQCCHKQLWGAYLQELA